MVRLALKTPKRAAAALSLAGLVLAGCASTNVDYSYPTPERGPDGRPIRTDAPRESVFGEGGLSLDKMLGRETVGGEQGGGGIGVNSYLWRASLDTLTFMPLDSADPFGGVIITEWHSPAETPNERFKVTVYILGTELRSDGLKVSVFRQLRDGDGWRDGPLDARTATELEDVILTRARQFRIDATAAPE